MQLGDSLENEEYTCDSPAINKSLTTMTNTKKNKVKHIHIYVQNTLCFQSQNCLNCGVKGGLLNKHKE